MEVSVARFKPLWSGWMSGAARPPLSDAQCCSNYFQVCNLTTCRRNNNHKSEIWARNQISFSQQDSDDQRGVPVTERGVDKKCKKKKKKKFQGSKSSLIHPPRGLEMNCKRKKVFDTSSVSCLIKTNKKEKSCFFLKKGKTN